MPLWDMLLSLCHQSLQVQAALQVQVLAIPSCAVSLHIYYSVRCLTSQNTIVVPAPLLAGSQTLSLHVELSLAGECSCFFPVASYHANNKKNHQVLLCLTRY